MRVLVTGGLGLVGSSLVDTLVEQGHSVRAIDDLSTGRDDFRNPDSELIVGDINDELLMLKAIAGVEVVFHHAALAGVARSIDNPLATDRANTHGTLGVLDAARVAGVRRVVSASSAGVYGEAETRPTPEDAPLSPGSPYAVSKRNGEEYGRVFSELYGVETVALRYCNVYGPRQRPDSAYAAVIPLFIEALTSGEHPIVHGDGHQSRDFTYITDVVAANLAAAAAPADVCSGRAYNVAMGDEHSLLDLLGILARHLDVSPDPVHSEPRAGDVRHTCADPTAAARDLGFRAEVSFTDGLARTVDWFTKTRLATTVTA